MAPPPRRRPRSSLALLAAVLAPRREASGAPAGEPPFGPSVLELAPATFDPFLANQTCGSVSVALFTRLTAAPPDDKRERTVLAEFAAAAAELDGVACVGAIDCSVWSDFCGDHNVRKTPAVVMYPPVARSAAQFFSGQPEREALKAAVAKLIGSGDRTVALDAQGAGAFIRSPARPLKVLLFSSKKTTPVLFQALSSDQALWLHAHFGFVRSTDSELMSLFGVSPADVPLIVLQHGDLVATRQTYSGGEMTLPAVRRWILEHVPTTAFIGDQVLQEEDEFPELEVVEDADDDEAAQAVPTQTDPSKASRAKPVTSYQKMSNGDNGCPPGLEITSAKECEKALNTLGLSPKPVWMSAYPGVPRHCSIREKAAEGNPERMHFNAAASGQGREDLAPVCKMPSVPAGTANAPAAKPEDKGKGAAKGAAMGKGKGKTETGMGAGKVEAVEASTSAAATAAKRAAKAEAETKSPTASKPKAAGGKSMSSDYQRLGYGVASCPPGLDIPSLTECASALASLDITAQPAWVSNSPELPRKCSVRETSQKGSPERMHFNSASEGQGRADLAPVCKREPQPAPAHPSPSRAQGTVDGAEASPEAAVAAVNSLIPELTGSNQAELLEADGFSLIYLREGPITEPELAMLGALEQSFGPRLAEQKTQLRWMWVDLNVERKLRRAFDAPALPSAVVLNPHRRPRYAMVQHQEEQEEVRPVDEGGIEHLLNTVLGGDARFIPVPRKKLSEWAERV